MTYKNRPWQSIEHHLRTNYNVVGEVDLYHACTEPLQVYQALANAKQPHYRPEDKIIVYHYDTEYYYSKNAVGIGLYNFLSSLRALDISPSVCILMTNHYGFTKEIDAFYKEYYPKHDYINDCVTVVESNYQQMQTPVTVQDTSIDIDQIAYPYICLSGIKRPHRVLFLCLLKQANMLDQGLVAWHFAHNLDIDNHPVPKLQITASSNCQFITTVPSSRISEWEIDDQHRTVWQNHHHHFESNHKNPLIEGSPNEKSHRFNIPAVSKSFLYVALETTFDYPYPYMTEKTFRAIVQKRPFVIVGSPGSLKQLKQLGFKTFDNFWSEDYDSMENHPKRMNAVVDIVKQISSMSVDSLKELCYNMQSIIEYNFEFYINEYSKTKLESLLQNLK
jgi:hypothetical protein